MAAPALVTLTGGAGAGKTTLALAMAVSAPMPVRVLHGDDYYFAAPRDGGVWAPDENGTPRLDVGDPRSLDFDGLARATDAALAAAPAVVVDGLFARLVAPRTPARRLDVFVDLAADLRLARKVRRKCLQDGFPLDVLLRNYVDHRRAAHAQHVEPLRARCGVAVDGGGEPAAAAEAVWAAVRGAAPGGSGRPSCAPGGGAPPPPP